MRISKRLIRRVADNLISKKGVVSQYEIHEEIERKLGRSLTTGEKVRITLILRNEYIVDRVDVEKDSRIKIEFFTI